MWYLLNQVVNHYNFVKIKIKKKYRYVYMVCLIQDCACAGNTVVPLDEGFVFWSVRMVQISERPNPNNPIVFFDITVGNTVRSFISLIEIHVSPLMLFPKTRIERNLFRR